MATPSLLLIPDRYKAAKLYSQIPDSGDGDLTFARNSNATRVNSAGLIEKARENIVLQSNTFSNASWNKTNLGLGSVAVVTPNYTTDPFGGNNAWRFQCNLNGGTTSSDRSWMLQSFAPFANSVLSIYIKLNVAGSKTVLLSNGGGGVQTITSTDWVRISIVTGASNGEFRIGLIGGSTSDTLDCSIAFAQAETGDIATDYIPTTTAAVSVGITADIPRLDYTGDGCPSLLLEPQRTNLALFSEQINNATWGTANLTITANALTSPDGYTNAELVTVNTSGSSYIQQSISVSANTAYTFSFYAKKGTATNIQYNVFDFSNFANIVAPTNFYNDLDGTNWTRIIIPFTTPSGCTSILISPNRDSTSTGTFYLYGCQLEAGAYPTSYIPTLGSSVTRLADTASKTGISSLIGQTEGTMYAEFKYNGAALNSVFERILALTDGTTNNRILIIKNGSTGNLYFYVEVGAVLTINATSIAGSAIGNNTNKLAIAYKSADYAIYLNGNLIFSDTQIAVPATSQLFVGSSEDGGTNQLGGTVAQAALYTTRLSNAELATLTAL